MATNHGRPGVDFIGIGAARSATSWLSNVLRAHPRVCLSDPKEIRFFNERLISLGEKKGKINPNFSKGLDWYEAHFAHARPQQIRGEYSPVYLCDETAPAEIHRHFPDVRLIASLRNPIDRAYSNYWQQKWLGVHSIPSFEEAIDEGHGYLEMGLYARQLKRYLDYFAREQIFVILFEELVASPTQELRRLFAFLEIEQVNMADVGAMDRNPTLSVRSKRLKHAARAVSQGLSGIGLGGLQRSLRRLGADRLWHTLMSKPQETPSLAQATRERLRSYFEDDVGELQEILGRDLSIWSN